MSESSNKFVFLEEKKLKEDIDRLEKKIEEEELKEDIDRLEKKIENIERPSKMMTNKYEDIYIPSFIKSYTDTELIELLKIFVDPKRDYTKTTRSNLELMYKNYLVNNSDESVNDIMDKLNK